MNRHTQIRQAVLARLRDECGEKAALFDGLPAFIDVQALPAVAVWLSDAQYTGKMVDEDAWQGVIHIAVFIRAQAPDSELDTWMDEIIYPALTHIPALSGLIDTMVPQGFTYQRDSEMATWAMAELTYRITWVN
ncbi:TPA: phage tail protein [Escherichia coli]|nr:phage tail protein [Escherichia coli]HEL8087563.1 phage tail protein [Escherichia coli]HEL8092581.1 phage tail protein [Escherichia coli]HEL8641610.1 phage tail protein [Escherichia coli]HEM0035697.1 phage tail protein [Escherichia coli]